MSPSDEPLEGDVLDSQGRVLKAAVPPEPRATTIRITPLDRDGVVAGKPVDFVGRVYIDELYITCTVCGNRVINDRCQGPCSASFRRPAQQQVQLKRMIW